MDAVVLLCDSTICRLCGEENDNGTSLFPQELDKENLSDLINKYLPIKVEKDGKFPCTLCPGCTIQLEATRSFFDLIVEGQNKLRLLFANQQDVLRRREKQKEELKNALKAASPGSSIIAVHDDDGDKIFIQVVTEGPLFSPEHELALRVEGLERPRKKRGRPPKPVQAAEEAAPVVEEARDEESDTEVDGKRKRKIKKPLRYQELLQGKELDRAFKEEGVLDDEETYSDNDPSTTDVKSTDDGVQEDDTVIGHMQDRNGEDLGQLVVSNKGGGKLRTKHKGGDAGKRKEKYDCEFCGRTFLHLGRLEVHRSFHKNIKYLCGSDDCLQHFETKTALEEHQKEAGHSGSKLIECLENYGQVELPQNSTEPPDVVAEESKQPDASPKSDTKITCDLCQKTFSCRQNYEVHLKAVHEKQKPFACDRCDKKFPYYNSLKIHMLQHNEKNYPCDACDKIFNHSSSLLYHKEAEHNGRKFVCNKCKKTFKHKQLLLRHQLVHTDERPHTCKSCDSSFKTRANLLNHMPTHTGEKKYYCPQCGQTFAHKTSLTLHIRWHNGQKPYECDVCMKTFSQKGNLTEHRRIHTGEKPYCCSYCERRFTTSSQFKLHVKRHTGEKPWKCEYCSKTFLHKDTWKCHTRRHRNERPYQCQQCLRGFIEQWALRKHERLHTGERPYVCDVCSKSFADSSNLAKHKKIHWNQKIKEKEKEKDAAARGGGINIVNVPDASDAQDTNRILYLTYQDSDSQSAQPETLVHIVDTMDESPKMEETLFGEDNVLPEENGEEISLNIQLQQLVDNDGNAISLTTVDGQQIKVVSTVTDDEQCIQGLLPDGTLVPINLMMQDGKTDPSTKPGNPASPKEDAELQDSQDLLQETIRLFADEGKVQFSGGKTGETNKFQVFAEDGQNVFLMPYDIDGSMPNNLMDME